MRGSPKCFRQMDNKSLNDTLFGLVKLSSFMLL
jgi:hypothetical protein